MILLHFDTAYIMEIISMYVDHLKLCESELRASTNNSENSSMNAFVGVGYPGR